MDEIIKDIILEENEEESVYNKLFGLEAEVDQMERMIEENASLIAEGDDIEGRTYLKRYLENEVRKKKAEIARIKEMIGEM